MSTDGPAGTAVSSLLGLYNYSHQYNSRPVYQLDKGGQYLFYNDGGYWMIGSEASGFSGSISTELRGLLTPPFTGWQYFDNGKWNKDPRMKALYPGESLGETMFGVCH